MLQVGVHFLPLLVYVETEALAKQWLEVFFDSAECDPEDVGVGGCVENDSECCVIKDYLAELKAYHVQRMGRLEAKLAAVGGAFSGGQDPTYADVFIYTCVNTVLKCKGFAAFRESFGEPGPFEGCPNLLALAGRIGEREEVKEMAGKFEQAPI